LATSHQSARARSRLTASATTLPKVMTSSNSVDAAIISSVDVVHAMARNAVVAKSPKVVPLRTAPNLQPSPRSQRLSSPHKPQTRAVRILKSLSANAAESPVRTTVVITSLLMAKPAIDPKTRTKTTRARTTTRSPTSKSSQARTQNNASLPRVVTTNTRESPDPHVTSNNKILIKIRTVNKRAANTSASTTIEMVSARRVVRDSTVVITSRETTTAITRSPDPHASSANPVSLANLASPETTMMPTVAHPTPVATKMSAPSAEMAVTAATVATVVKVASAVVNVATIIIVTTMVSVATATRTNRHVVATEMAAKSPANPSTVNSRTRTEIALLVT